MGRVIVETVPVQMSYDEYRVYDAISRQIKAPVSETIRRLASIGAREFLAEEAGDR